MIEPDALLAPKNVEAMYKVLDFIRTRINLDVALHSNIDLDPDGSDEDEPNKSAILHARNDFENLVHSNFGTINNLQKAWETLSQYCDAVGREAQSMDDRSNYNSHSLSTDLLTALREAFGDSVSIISMDETGIRPVPKSVDLA